ncbi:MAG TPA: ABC transporter substrate-binding protein [Kofleriaceae bacterium]|nr:ABC transporter substrate-binding protein [Kofleriaceae bacterium]
MRRRAHISAGIGLVAAALGLAAAVRAETRPRYGRALVGSLLGKPVALDPVAARSHAEVQVVSLLFDSLYRIDEGGRVTPHLAVGLPALSTDRRQARVRVRAGALFHDGKLVTAAAAAASLERLRRSAAGWLLAPVASIGHEGDEVVLSLRRDTPELAELLAAPAASITPGGRAPGRSPVGSGPFSLARRPQGRGLELAAWERHFAGRPYADRLELRWFEGATAEARAYEIGALAMSFRGAVAFTGHQPKYQTEVTSGPAVVMVYVGFGRAHGRAFADRDLRRALSLAIGRDSMRNIGTGERVMPTPWPVAIELGGRQPERAELDARSGPALTALRAAERRVRALRARPRPTWELLVDRTRPDDREIGERVVAALYRLGLTGRIVELDPDQLARRVARGDFALYIGQLVSPGPSASLQIAAAFAAGGDSWAAQRLAAAPLDTEAALAAFEDRLPVLPLLHRSIRVHHRIDVRRITFDATGRLQYADLFLFGGVGAPATP